MLTTGKKDCQISKYPISNSISLIIRLLFMGSTNNKKKYIYKHDDPLKKLLIQL